MSLASIGAFVARNWKWEVPLLAVGGIGAGVAAANAGAPSAGGAAAEPAAAQVTPADEQAAQRTATVVVRGQDPYSGTELQTKAQIITDIRAKAGIPSMDEGTSQLMSDLGRNFGLENLGVDRTADVIRSVRELGIDPSTKQGAQDAYLASFDVFRSNAGTADDMVARFHKVDQQLQGVQHTASDVARVMRYDDDRIAWMRDVVAGTDGFINVANASALLIPADLDSLGDDAFNPEVDAQTAVSDVKAIAKSNGALTSDDVTKLESEVMSGRRDPNKVQYIGPPAFKGPREEPTPASLSKFVTELEGELPDRYDASDAADLAAAVAKQGSFGKVKASAVAKAFTEVEPMVVAGGLDVEDSTGFNATPAEVTMMTLGDHAKSAKAAIAAVVDWRAERLAMFGDG